MKLKVCGMTQSANITDLIAVNPDFIGFIFYKKSPRFCMEVPIEIPAGIKKVGVFVNETISTVLEIQQSEGLDFIQLHGTESAQYCETLTEHKIQLIKAFHVDVNFDFNQIKAYIPFCTYFLFDTKGKNLGGNGYKFNWELLKKYKEKTKFLLSGGITLDDVNCIKKLEHPSCMGLDINSGFEIQAGLKDVHKINLFKKEINELLC